MIFLLFENSFIHKIGMNAIQAVLTQKKISDDATVLRGAASVQEQHIFVGSYQKSFF